MRTKKRTLLTNKVYGFNPWMDQVTAINQLMEATGQKSEAPIVRDLIDEALAVRRRKQNGTEAAEPQPATAEANDTLQTIEALLLRVIGQSETAFRVESLSLELLQETLAEARAGRLGIWQVLVTPALNEKGKSASEIANLFHAHSEDAKDFAYGLAEEIRNEPDATVTADSESTTANTEEDDRQGRLFYQQSDQPEN
jgi:hypothetical protein